MSDCTTPECTSPAEYPDGLCRDCHEQSIRRGDKQDAQPLGVSYQGIAKPKTTPSVSKPTRGMR